MRDFVLMQQAWTLNDDLQWEKIRLLGFLSANHFSKPIKLTDIIKIPSIDGDQKKDYDAMREKLLAFREKLMKNSGPAK